jgi:hypothetical protein
MLTRVRNNFDVTLFILFFIFCPEVLYVYSNTEIVTYLYHSLALVVLKRRIFKLFKNCTFLLTVKYFLVNFLIACTCHVSVSSHIFCIVLIYALYLCLTCNNRHLIVMYVGKLQCHGVSCQRNATAPLSLPTDSYSAFTTLFSTFKNKRHITIFEKYLVNSKFITISHSFVFQFINKNLFTLGLLNKGSLGTKHDEFVVALENRSVDIMAINETWLKENEEKRAPMPPGYRLRHIPRPKDSKKLCGGGVGFYIRKNIYARQIKVPHMDTVEQMWIGVSLGGHKIAIGTAYRAPWVNVSTFFDALTASITSLSSYDHIIVFGDFNIDLLTPSLAETMKLNNFLHYTDMEQYVNTPTHFTDHSETLIDVVCSTTKVFNVRVDYIPDLGRHAFITCQLRLNKPKQIPQWIQYRPLKDINLKEFNPLVNTINWETLLSTDVNEAVTSLNAYLLHIYDIHAPIIKCCITHKSYPWITPTIRMMMGLRDGAHSKSRLTKREEDRKFYKELKSTVNKAMYTEKAAYFRYSINSNSSDSKKLWSNIKKNVVDFKQKPALPPCFNDPDVVNNHFLNVPGNNNVSSEDLMFFENNKFCDKSFKLKTVDDITISKIIMGITTNAEGLDGITRDMVILTLPRTLGFITAIVNLSIESGVFPDIWKQALVKPLPKINNPFELNHLRPISILPFLSKIIEKVVCQQLTEFLKSNNILPLKQSGFRAGYSTATALLDVIDGVLTGIDRGKGSIIALLDFSRAFDTINHELLLAKLSFYGFDDRTLKWFTSYLSGRSQRVEIANETGIKTFSEALPIGQGVPQGSILGPILFNLYSSDLPNTIKSCNHHIYADDVQIYLSFEPKHTISAVESINADLARISEWAHRNCLVLNPQKTKFLVLGSPRQIDLINNFDPELRIGGAVIEQVTEARNLGVLMDNTLKFHSHVLETVKNCFYRLRVLYQVHNFLDVDRRIMLCETLILSKLNYADTVIGDCLYGYTKKLIQRVQNACARFCFAIPRRAHVTPFLNQSNLMSMKTRHSYHFACMLFGIVHTKSPPYLYSKLTFSHRPTRSAQRLLGVQHSTAAFRGSFRYSATKCWNNIPPPIRNCRTVSSFKLQYKQYLLNLQKSI